MKNSILIAALWAAGMTTQVSAQTFSLQFGAETVQHSFHLSRNDVLTIDTKVPIGSAFTVLIKPTIHSDEIDQQFNFSSSVVGVKPDRHGPFVDFIVAGANPGWVSYRYCGEIAVDVEVIISK